jgi:hypothetical protein
MKTLWKHNFKPAVSDLPKVATLARVYRYTSQINQTHFKRESGGGVY